MENPNITDWLNVLLNLLIAAGTIGALWFAVKSSKDTAAYSRETLEEAQENRKDDVMPVLQRTFDDSPGPDYTVMRLKNVGQGPLFHFRVKNDGPGIKVQQAPKDDGVVYTILAYRGQVPVGEDKSAVITYCYQDMYRRKFEATHKITELPGGQLQFDNDISIPKKISS